MTTVPVSAKTATPAAVMIESGTVATVPSEVTALSVEVVNVEVLNVAVVNVAVVTVLVVTGATVADVTLTTDLAATCSTTDAAGVVAETVVIVETVETVREESASEAPLPPGARSLLLI